jgi:hypothetical protein
MKSGPGAAGALSEEALPEEALPEAALSEAALLSEEESSLAVRIQNRRKRTRHRHLGKR